MWCCWTHLIDRKTGKTYELDDSGAVICESELEADLPDECGGLRKIKQHRYGTVLVTRYQKDWDE